MSCWRIHTNIRPEAFTATELDKIFSGNRPCQLWIKTRRLGDHLRLHDQRNDVKFDRWWCLYTWSNFPPMTENGHSTNDGWLADFSGQYWLDRSDPKLRCDTPSEWFWVRFGRYSPFANGRSGGNFDHEYKHHQRSNFTSFPRWWMRRWSPKRWAFIHNWHGLLPETILSINKNVNLSTPHSNT
jgi:hypothetical protein